MYKPAELYLNMPDASMFTDGAATLNGIWKRYYGMIMR